MNTSSQSQPPAAGEAAYWPITEEKYYAYEAAPGVWQVIERLSPRDSFGSCRVRCFADLGDAEHAELFARFIANKANGLVRGEPLYPNP